MLDTQVHMAALYVDALRRELKALTQFGPGYTLLHGFTPVPYIASSNKKAQN